ncbi:hypothetical protein LJ707_08315 [Mucilaginibacter sp. UR6-1]|nr:hypothetical protein [Mucilaginibacter sp. UR6-1]
MIKHLQYLALTALCISFISATAQKLPQADSAKYTDANKRAKTFFFELLGPGAAYSVNYDVRFKKQQNGWGGRAGISYYANAGEHLFTVPLVVNYLAGKNGKYFEVGGGITYYNVNSNDLFFDNTNYGNSADDVNSGIIGTLNFGYRYQPVDGGFSFRGGVSPVINSERFLPYWPYISFGYAF